jgi:hypothetical protein
VGWPNIFAGAGASSYDVGGSSQWALQGWQVGMSGIPFVCQSLTSVLTGMGRPGICCCVRNVHDLDARHLVQVRVTRDV